MEANAAAYVGMGLAAAGMAGSGAGLGYLFGKVIEAFSRQPSAESKFQKYVWIGAAFVEAVALYGLVIALMIMP